MTVNFDHVRNHRQADLSPIDEISFDGSGGGPSSNILTKWEELPTGIVKSAGRTMQILEFFDDYKSPASITEISRALSYPTSSTAEIIWSLHAMGYLSYDGAERTFIPTSRVRFLGSWVNSRLHGVDRLSRLIQKVNMVSGQTTFLAIRNNLSSQYIQVAQATTTLRLHLTPGQRRPLLRSASGLALLKNVDDAEISKIVRRANAERSECDEVLEAAKILDDVHFVRKNNYIFVANSKISPGAAVIAMTLPETLFPVPTVIGVGGVAEVISPKKDALIKFMTNLILNDVGSGTSQMNLSEEEFWGAEGRA
ncbi:MAG: helix-turn-helix domain-containing protein [Hyphomonadaceae bacterium]|nr:helix-turn-helix domain-containing protein [Hyphomonadaceae bacterium]